MVVYSLTVRAPAGDTGSNPVGLANYANYIYMEAIAQLVERQIVALKVMGS